MKTICQIVLLLALLPLVSCCEGRQATASNAEADTLATWDDTVAVQYAKGFSVSHEADGIHIILRNPDPGARHAKADTVILTAPASRFICTTALQLGNFETLGLEDRIVGINSLKSLHSPVVTQRIQDGTTVRIGREGDFDLEAVLSAKADFILVSASKRGGFEALKDCGVPLIPHHGYKETDPLGQAEWIKLIGLLTGQVRKANAVFADIERQYNDLKATVAALDEPRPSVASGRQVREGWYAVGGQSYMAHIFADAGAQYVMATNEASGGVTLDFEAAYATHCTADFWQIDGRTSGAFTLATLAAEDARYATMKAYQSPGHVLFCSLTDTPYRELAGVEPHILLADFVSAFHPKAINNYQPKYYKPIY